MSAPKTSSLLTDSVWPLPSETLQDPWKSLRGAFEFKSIAHAQGYLEHRMILRDRLNVESFCRFLGSHGCEPGYKKDHRPLVMQLSLKISPEFRNLEKGLALREEPLNVRSHLKAVLSFPLEFFFSSVDM